MCMYFSHGDDVIALLSSFAYHSSLDCGRFTNICAERLWIPSNDVLSATINYSANFPEFPFNMKVRLFNLKVRLLNMKVRLLNMTVGLFLI